MNMRLTSICMKTGANQLRYTIRAYIVNRKMSVKVLDTHTSGCYNLLAARNRQLFGLEGSK